MDTPPLRKPPWLIGAIAAGCALAWLAAESVREPAIFASVSMLILVIMFVPTSRRRRPYVAVLGATAAAACLAALIVAALSGLRGPAVIWLFAATMVGLGVGVPIVFAATFPNRRNGDSA